MILRVAPPKDAPHTVEDLHAMPDDGNRYELLFGEIVMSPSPSTMHQQIVGRVYQRFSQAAESLGGGALMAPLDVDLLPLGFVQPDLVVVLPGGAPRVRDDGVHGAPDIVVEVLSPSTRGHDLVKKTVLYSSAGVPEYWVIDPEAQTVTIRELEGVHYRDRTIEQGVAISERLPAFSVDLDQLFDVPAWMVEAE